MIQYMASGLDCQEGIVIQLYVVSSYRTLDTFLPKELSIPCSH